MNRRTFLCGLTLGILGAPPATEAQPAAKVYRVGVLNLTSRDASSGFRALREGLRELGYAENANIIFEYRWPEGQAGRLPALAAELVQLKLDVIVTGDPQTA